MRRRIIIITLLLILSGGAIVNITVAWGCALGVGRSMGPNVPMRVEHFPRATDELENWIVMQSCRPGWVRIVSVDLERGSQIESIDQYDHLAAIYAFLLPAHEATLEEMHIPSWSRVANPDDRLPATLFEDGFGWPMLSLYSRTRATQNNVVVAADTWNLPLIVVPTGPFVGTLADWNYPRVLPMRPIRVGFIINTLFYAALLWLLFFAPFAARRMLRRRRGLCETCAYPVGVSPVCTECGAAVRTSVARSS